MALENRAVLCLCSGADVLWEIVSSPEYTVFKKSDTFLHLHETDLSVARALASLAWSCVSVTRSGGPYNGRFDQMVTGQTSVLFSLPLSRPPTGLLQLYALMLHGIKQKSSPPRLIAHGLRFHGQSLCNIHLKG